MTMSHHYKAEMLLNMTQNQMQINVATVAFTHSKCSKKEVSFAITITRPVKMSSIWFGI